MQTLSQSKPKAHKPHWCEWCGRTIEPGEVYQQASLLGDDGFYAWANCLHCAALVTLAALWECCCDEGVTSDDIAEWDPRDAGPDYAGVAAAWKEQWRKEWRRTDGTLYPVPTKAAS
jgi:hypothetical protein